MNKNSLKETYVQHKTGNLQMNLYEFYIDAPYHWHDECEFICVTNGKCECIINGKNIEVESGQVVLITPGELHAVNSIDDGHFFAIVFHPYMIFGTEVNDLFSKNIIFKRIFDKNTTLDKSIISAIFRIRSTFYNRYFGFELIIKALITEIFGTIYENKFYTLSNKKEAPAFNQFAHIIEYIHNHFNEKILLDDVVIYSNFSKSYLIRLFKKNTGKTFSSYLNSYRIYKAKEMLDDGNESILEISANCGFENVAYFIKIFKRITGTTPYKYRTR